MIRLGCVLLNYRNPGDTLACLESLAVDPVAGLKIYLVNNFAGDGSGPMLRGYLEASGLDFAYIEPGFNSGFAAGCNLGIRAALHDACSHIILLNNDTTVAPDFSREVARLAELHPDDVIAGEVLETGGEPTYNIGRISPLTGKVRNIFDPAWRGEIDFVSGCLMIAPAAAFREAGGFDERLFMYSEDLDICMRFRRMGYRARYCPTIRVRHKPSSSSKASGLPQEYYSVRNQTYVILRRGTVLQRFLYLGYLLALPFAKRVLRPRIWRQSVRGARDGILGRMGVRHRAG